eukprot:scaffold92061_cov38-Tisochrysis_lutea.AAC.1
MSGPTTPCAASSGTGVLNISSGSPPFPKRKSAEHRSPRAPLKQTRGTSGSCSLRAVSYIATCERPEQSAITTPAACSSRRVSTAAGDASCLRLRSVPSKSRATIRSCGCAGAAARAPAQSASRESHLLEGGIAPGCSLTVGPTV